jgi:ATP-dependent RNA helicase SUPV3L1/SUV3
MQQQYLAARGLNRQHHFYLGPTNSGKTYRALNALMQAPSGVYLAPLRLLAMEVRDKLMQAGIPCNLITGEERDMIEGAQHSACTIEMMNPARIVDVAVIDEIQMLHDRDRGSAWTAALLGVPAREVFICGADSATAICVRALETLNEPFDIHYCERMTPLALEADSFCGSFYSKLKVRDRLQKGDAVIAFSRKDVLTLSARFRQWGFSVASIYGALSPEVRRHEATRFSQGLAQVLVATDAIGMGLNLPIRRIIFASTTKYDGQTNRALNATEVRQIAGRAGRYGQYETGYVNVLEDHERHHIERMLDAGVTDELLLLPTRVEQTQIVEMANRLRTNNLTRCLDALIEDNTAVSGLYARANVTSALNQAYLVDLHAPNLTIADKFTFACAPTSVETQFESAFFIQCLTSVAKDAIQLLPETPDWLVSGQSKRHNPRYLEDAEALSQNISLYAWLSHQWPTIFTQAEQIKEWRRKLSDYTTAALMTQSGYLETAREVNANPVWRRRR